MHSQVFSPVSSTIPSTSNPPNRRGQPFWTDLDYLYSLNEGHSNLFLLVTIHWKILNTNTTYFLLLLWHHDLRATKVSRNLLIDLKTCPLTPMLERSAQTDPCFNDCTFLCRIRATKIQQLILWSNFWILLHSKLLKTLQGFFIKLH